MKIILTNEDFVPPIGTFEYGSMNSDKLKHCIEISNRLGQLLNCIKDETLSTRLALRLDCQIPLWNFTFSPELYNNWDWDKDVGENLFANKVLYPADRIIKVKEDPEDGWSYTMCSFFGGPFPEEIAMYIFEAWRFNKEVTDIKKFLQMIGNNAMKIYETYNEQKPKFEETKKKLGV